MVLSKNKTEFVKKIVASEKISVEDIVEKDKLEYVPKASRASSDKYIPKASRASSDKYVPKASRASSDKYVHKASRASSDKYVPKASRASSDKYVPKASRASSRILKTPKDLNASKVQRVVRSDVVQEKKYSTINEPQAFETGSYGTDSFGTEPSGPSGPRGPGGPGGPFRNGCCCNYFCNKRGLFTEIDMAFSNMMQLVPNSNVACRCCNKLFTAPISQGRSCACLIRPRQRPGSCLNSPAYNNARGCSPQRCGCNNHIWQDIYAQ
jgi:hypothetical protein